MIFFLYSLCGLNLNIILNLHKKFYLHYYSHYLKEYMISIALMVMFYNSFSVNHPKMQIRVDDNKY